MKLLAEISLEGEWATDETLEYMIKDTIRNELRAKIREVIRGDSKLRKRIVEVAEKLVEKSI